MENLILASAAFDKAASTIHKEKQNKVFIDFDTIDEAIKYINDEIIKASDKGNMMIMPSLYVKVLDQYKLYDLLKEAGYKVYRGLAGELYLSWEVGTPFEEKLKED